MVFDEADRLFEMGFEVHLNEILHKLPVIRQTLLFSATLPKSLFEFAKAGLDDPILVRLDTDAKMSSDLETAFFSVKPAEKEASLLYLLQELVKMPSAIGQYEHDDSMKERRRPKPDDASPFATLIFTATKHHVEYLSRLLIEAGYAVSAAYGSMDQDARLMNLHRFRSGRTTILVTTDVAARGLDIPLLANVINYDYPHLPKMFIHRVGRTARAGRRGWAYSFMTSMESAYFVELQLFLARKLVSSCDHREIFDYNADLVYGAIPQDEVETFQSTLQSLNNSCYELENLKRVAVKGEKLYVKTRPLASGESIRRAKELVSTKGWSAAHPLILRNNHSLSTGNTISRNDMMARVSEFRPRETIFELGYQKTSKGKEAADVMRAKRNKVKPRARTEESLPKKPVDYRDSENYIDYFKNTAAAEDRGYSISHGKSFMEAARTAVLDIADSDKVESIGNPGMTNMKRRWDKKKKDFVNVQNDIDGSKGTRFVRGESGTMIPISLKSGRYV